MPNRNDNRQDWDTQRSSRLSDRGFDQSRYSSDEDMNMGSAWGSDRDYNRGFEREGRYDRDFDRNFGRSEQPHEFWRDYNRDRGFDRARDLGGRDFGSERDWGQERDYGRRDRETGAGYGAGGMGFGGYGLSSGYGQGGRSDIGNWGRSRDFERDYGYGGTYGRGGESYRDTDRSGLGGLGQNLGFRRGGYGFGSTNRDVNYGIDRDMSTDRMSYAGRGPKGYQRSDDRIREDVSEALALHPDIDASEIEVDVKEGYVILRGSVDDRRTKRMAEDAVENISGVRDVRNELSVNKSLFERAREALTGETTAPSRGSTTPPKQAKH